MASPAVGHGSNCKATATHPFGHGNGSTHPIPDGDCFLRGCMLTEMQCGMWGDSATLLVIYGVSVRFLEKLVLMMTYEVVTTNPSDSEGKANKERKGKDQIISISQEEESHQAPKQKG
ncbi:unnamed protein product [Miscanthus lutarioriparius]|uniref:Uncharacterized protein n=1 Tax=Miscanthus lutarioriparius TaxID=422564 RepID=A0A811PWQ8_9POAL|nr:unnamed protein product [Miscanthus lutarioriparius]